jgi:hypothetical protein
VIAATAGRAALFCTRAVEWSVGVGLAKLADGSRSSPGKACATIHVANDNIMMADDMDANRSQRDLNCST